MEEYEAILPRHVEADDQKLRAALAMTCETRKSTVPPELRPRRAERALTDRNLGLRVGFDRKQTE